MNERKTCQVLCRRQYDRAELKAFENAIDKKYRVNWILDNLPGITHKHADLQKHDNLKQAVVFWGSTWQSSKYLQTLDWKAHVRLNNPNKKNITINIQAKCILSRKKSPKAIETINGAYLIFSLCQASF